MRAAVIADDLTGAADAGAQLARAGYRTGVAFWGAPVPPAPDLDAVVVDTDSRELAPAEAAERAAAAAGALSRAPLLLKKVDSTLRGPIGPEVRAALQASGRARVVFAPAFPALGRITRGGVQYVDGQPLTDLRQLVSDPCVVADAEEQDDLVALVHAVADPEQVLWVGSAGLAGALGTVHPGPREFERMAGPSRAAVLVAIGSATATAQAQVSRLAAAVSVEAIPLSLEAWERGHASRRRFGRLPLRGRPHDRARRGGCRPHPGYARERGGGSRPGGERERSGAQRRGDRDPRGAGARRARAADRGRARAGSAARAA